MYHKIFNWGEYMNRIAWCKLSQWCDMYYSVQCTPPTVFFITICTVRFFPPRNYNLSFYCLNNFLHSLLFAGSVWQYRQPYQQRHRFLREVRSFRRPAMQNRAGICKQIKVRHFILSSKNLTFLCWYIALSTDRLRGHQ